MPTKTRKVKKDRKSPSTSATLHSEGTIEYGNDTERWVVKQTDKGVKRWVPYYSTTLFGYTPLTAKILQKNIGKPLVVYERQSRYTWPTKAGDFDVKYTFIASGEAEIYKGKDSKLISNWLRTRKPAVKKNEVFIIKGDLTSNDITAEIKVSPLPAELVSTNLMNTDAFVKI